MPVFLMLLPMRGNGCIRIDYVAVLRGADSGAFRLSCQYWLYSPGAYRQDVFADRKECNENLILQREEHGVP